MTLTLGYVRGLAAMLDQRAKQFWPYFVVRPEHVEDLRREIPELPRTSIEPPLSALSAFGVGIYPKPGQRAAGWAFRDHKILRDYLAGTLTEDDLIRLQEEERKKLAEGSLKRMDL